MDVLFLTIVLSFLPISELRGSIPYALYNDVPWFIAYPLCAALNALVAPVCWIFLGTLHKLFLKMEWYRRFFERFIEKARAKLAEGVKKWGWFGVSLFVAIPLPITGAWTGTLGAWVLGLSKRKTMLAVAVGVLIAGAVVTSVVMFGVQALQIFLRK
ncbi:MAG: small multi-drug export protein [Treponema sp.]|jgi:uncharacterized membrane protein|nr:small multi-drug export protein [Treponema sp.]